MRIFDEKSYAEKMLTDGFLGSKMGSDLLILAKYYFYLGELYETVWKNLSIFCSRFLKEYDEDLYAEKIDGIVKTANRLNLRIPVNVPITEKEIQSIKEIKNYKLEKVLFTMLVLAKYYKLTNPSKKNASSKYYYVNNSFNEILKYAHTTQKGNEVVHKLYVLGKIDRSKIIDSYIIKFTDNEDTSDIEILVTNMENIISFYPFYCSKCGKDIIRTGRSQKMCNDCWKEQQRENSKISMRKKRSQC